MIDSELTSYSVMNLGVTVDSSMKISAQCTAEVNKRNQMVRNNRKGIEI